MTITPPVPSDPTDPAAAGFDAVLDVLRDAGDLVRDPVRGRPTAQDAPRATRT